MICRFCRLEFDSEEFPIACPACGDALVDEWVEDPEAYSLIYEQGKYSIIEGYVKNSVFLGSYNECTDLKEVLIRM
jgi:hypothetical protein